MGLMDVLFGNRTPMEALRDGDMGRPAQMTPAPQQAPQGGGGGRDWGAVLSELAPALMLMDPLGRNNQAAAMLMNQNARDKKDKQGAQNQNETFQWLVGQGMDPGEAKYLTSDSDALRAWFGQRQNAGKPDWKITRGLNDQGQEQDFLVDMNNPTSRQPIGGAKSDLMSPGLVDQKERIAQAGASKTIGAPPAGYGVRYDERNNPTEMYPVPGGPADTSAKDAVAAGTRSTASDVITGAASKARQILNDSGRLAVGTGGNILSSFGESQAAELRRQVDVLKSNATIETLGAMRAASPTGGALGAVSDSENKMLAAKAGALDPSAGPGQFAAQLDDYERTLLRLIHGNEAGDRIFLESRGTGDADPQSGDVVDYREFFGGQ